MAGGHWPEILSFCSCPGGPSTCNPGPSSRQAGPRPRALPLGGGGCSCPVKSGRKNLRFEADLFVPHNQSGAPGVREGSGKNSFSVVFFLRSPCCVPSEPQWLSPEGQSERGPGQGCAVGPLPLAGSVLLWVGEAGQRESLGLAPLDEGFESRPLVRASGMHNHRGLAAAGGKG